MDFLWYFDIQEDNTFHSHAIKNVIYRTPGKQEVVILDSYTYGKILVINGLIQSTQYDEFIYHESLIHPAMISAENPKRVLIIGAGEGASIREVLKYDVDEVVAVDIDKNVIELVKKYLSEWHQSSFDNPKVKLVFEDGFEFVKKYKGEQFDVVILDLTDPHETSASRNLYTIEFYKEVKKLVKDILVTQGTSPYQSPHSFSIIYKTLRQVFNYVSVGLSFVPSFDTIWGFFFCSDKINVKNVNVSERLSRVKGVLKYYDEITHKSMFSLPKNVRELLAKEEGISTLENPVVFS
ncbi:MAG: methyltransferase domain-containing protein [Stygiolobus sp.]|nr:methyltransferase domain-containing protein [Stygiolobus sp.]